MFVCKINLFVCLLWLSFSTFRSIIWSINYAMTMTNALHIHVIERFSQIFSSQQHTSSMHTRAQYTHTHTNTIACTENTWNRYLMKWQKRCNRNCLQMFVNICFTPSQLCVCLCLSLSLPLSFSVSFFLTSFAYIHVYSIFLVCFVCHPFAIYISFPFILQFALAISFTFMALNVVGLV